MDINAAFPSTWLKNSDLNGRAVRLIMKDVVMEEVGDDHKAVLYFQNAKKGLVLNKINSASISSVYGPLTENWAGKPIEVYPDMTIFAGKPTPCIRVRARMPAAPQPAPAPPPTAVDDGHTTVSQLDDEVPW